MGRNSIKLYLVSGFLGCGKTTLLKNMLSIAEKKKVGILVNEFGDVGIDGKILDKNGIRLTEVTGGSIYCVCRKGDFMKALMELSQTDIELLLVENSGMADPANIHKLLVEFAGKLNRPMDYQGSICVIDSVSFLKRVQVLLAVQNQVRASGLVVINKVDLVEPDVIEDIKDKVRELNPQAVCVETTYADIPVSMWEEVSMDSDFDENTSNRCGDRSYITTSLKAEGEISSQAMIEVAEKMAKNAIRLKGVFCTEKGWQRLDAVNGTVTMETYVPKKKDEKGILVVIREDNGALSEDLERIGFKKID